jgi:hypothetical protein
MNLSELKTRIEIFKKNPLTGRQLIIFKSKALKTAYQIQGNLLETDKKNRKEIEEIIYFLTGL